MLRRFGQNPEAASALLDGTGVSPSDIENPAAEITLFQQLRQLDNLSELLDEDWVFQAPEIWGATSHGVPGMAMLTAPTLQAALGVFSDLAEFRAPFARRRMMCTQKEWRIDLIPSWPLTDTQWRHLAEANFIMLDALIAAYLGPRGEGLVYRLPGPAPSYLDRARAVLGGGVAYGGSETFAKGPAGLLPMTSPGADPRLHEQLIGELKAVIAERSSPDYLRYRVVRLLATMPEGEPLSESAVTRALALSRRTLVRRLSESGTSFRKLQDAEKKARAEKWLSAGNLTHAEIAGRLGYADATSFSRACRRWFG